MSPRLPTQERPVYLEGDREAAALPGRHRGPQRVTRLGNSGGRGPWRPPPDRPARGPEDPRSQSHGATEERPRAAPPPAGLLPGPTVDGPAYRTGHRALGRAPPASGPPRTAPIYHTWWRPNVAGASTPDRVRNPQNPGALADGAPLICPGQVFHAGARPHASAGGILHRRPAVRTHPAKKRCHQNARRSDEHDRVPGEGRLPG